MNKWTSYEMFHAAVLCLVEYVIPEFFGKADAFWQTQGHNEQKFARTRSWGHGNRLGPRYLYGSKMANFPFIKTGYLVLFFHFDFWGTSNQQNWLIFSPDGDFSTAISNLVRLFWYDIPVQSYSLSKWPHPSKMAQKRRFLAFDDLEMPQYPKDMFLTTKIHVIITWWNTAGHFRDEFEPSRLPNMAQNSHSHPEKSRFGAVSHGNP